MKFNAKKQPSFRRLCRKFFSPIKENFHHLIHTKNLMSSQFPIEKGSNSKDGVTASPITTTTRIGIHLHRHCMPQLTVPEFQESESREMVVKLYLTTFSTNFYPLPCNVTSVKESHWIFIGNDIILINIFKNKEIHKKMVFTGYLCHTIMKFKLGTCNQWHSSYKLDYNCAANLVIFLIIAVN